MRKMHIVDDDDPVFVERRRFNPVSGSELTTGNLGKISNAVASVLADIAELNARLDALETAAGAAAPLLIREAP